jgi:PAS domain S-box-containing protein
MTFRLVLVVLFYRKNAQMYNYSTFDNIRNRIADKLLLMGLIFSVPASVVSGYRIISMGLEAQFIVDVLITIILIAVFLTRNKTNYRKRMAFLIGYVFLLGIFSLYTWGLWGLGIFIFFFTIVLTTTLFGMRYGLGVMVISVVVFVVFALSIHYQWITYRWDFNTLAHSSSQWVLRGVFFIVYSSIIVITLGLVYNDFEMIYKNLVANEERFNLALVSVNEVVWDLDLTGLNSYRSKNFSTVFPNIDPSFTLSIENWMKFVYHKDLELVNNAVEAIISGATSDINIEYRLKTKHDGTQWLLTRGRIVSYSNAGKPKRIVGTHSDITSRKEMERILIESEERFRMLFMNANDAILLIAGGIIVDVNKSCLQFFGTTREQLVGLELSDVSCSSVDNQECSERLALLFSDAKNGIFKRVEWEFKRADGRILDSIMSIGMLYNESKPIFQIILHDITERKRFEQLKLNAIVETEERERLRLAGDLHDDVGPLLSSLNMYLSLLNREQTENKDEIVSNMQSIIKETIKSVRVISNNISPHTLNNYGLAMAVRSFLEQGSKLLEINIEENLGGARFTTIVEVMVYRITKELFNNTVKYAKANSVWVSMNLRDNFLHLTYRDDGVGFDFERVVGEAKAGIGLLNMINRVKSLKGKYRFDSKPGEGTRFDMLIRI